MLRSATGKILTQLGGAFERQGPWRISILEYGERRGAASNGLKLLINNAKTDPPLGRGGGRMRLRTGRSSRI